ncbi:MAG: RsmD family RNA methyltransferase [Planctomycetota bacterium]|jgi:16S rRNA G966 N2-methylase RsmD
MTLFLLTRVFVDPPYADTADVDSGSALAGVLGLVCEQVTSNGFVVVRTRRSAELPERYGALGVVERREWGTMAVTILQRQENDR